MPTSSSPAGGRQLPGTVRRSRLPGRHRAHGGRRAGRPARRVRVRRHAESFAAFASGGACEGATAADAVAALDAAERAGAAIPAMSAGR
jgi:hypothetical protein